MLDSLPNPTGQDIQTKKCANCGIVSFSFYSMIILIFDFVKFCT